MKLAAVYAPRRHWPKWDWIAAAIEARGHKLMRVHASEDLLAADSWADAVLFEHRDCGIGRRYVRDVHAKRQALWVQWWFDLIATNPSVPLAAQTLMETCAESMRCMDMVLVKERSLVEEYRKLGIPATYMDQACPSWFPMIAHMESPPYDVLMFGEVKGNRREIAAALVKEGFSVAWATNTAVPAGVKPLPWCNPESLPALMCQARCVLYMNVTTGVDGYCSDRDWLIRGCGAIGINSDTTGIAIGGVRWAKTLSMPERASLGASNRQRAMQGNTYEDRVDAIVRLVEGFRCGNSLQNLRRDEDCHQSPQGASAKVALSGV